MNGSFCALCALALWLELHIYTGAKQLSTVAILLYRFLSYWYLQTFSRSISLVVHCLQQKVFNASVEITGGHVLYFQFSEKKGGLISGLTL